MLNRNINNARCANKNTLTNFKAGCLLSLFLLPCPTPDASEGRGDSSRKWVSPSGYWNPKSKDEIGNAVTCCENEKHHTCLPWRWAFTKSLETAEV